MSGPSETGVEKVIAGSPAPLLADDVLTVASLASTARGPVELTPPTVTCGRPLVYPVSPADLPEFLRSRAAAGGRHYWGVLFAFDLDGVPAPQRCTSVTFDVALDDPDAIAIDIHPDGDALGLDYELQPTHGVLAASALGLRAVVVPGSRRAWLQRLRPLAAAPRPTVSGVQSGHLRWVFADPRGRGAVPSQLALHALLELPAGLRTLRGRIRVRAVVARGGWRETAALVETMRPVTFAEPLGSSASAGEPAPTAAVRLCLAADVVGYSAQGNGLAGQTQQRLVDILAAARRRAGVSESATDRQPQGDEEFDLLPVGIDESFVIARLVEGIRDGLRTVNAAGAGLRLPVALHRGLVGPAANGWTGAAPIASTAS